MDALHTHILTLDRKIDGLYEIIDHLSHTLSSVISENSLKTAKSEENHHAIVPDSDFTHRHSDGLEILMEHKDVLVDGSHLEIGNSSSETLLTPEVQIQRLTAQLTAAYNRIAALEEQLLSRQEATYHNAQIERVRSRD
ncbi:hypothetical protein AY599_22790 [Leptolyngbya valderiana BDU 20041]|uniref:hypothetical protein n=1 Tax=Baaleninema simplex TaxID=2862350 RepID=UPI00034AF406|nr:hypothetical protein [Baaleninema simplex]MDC0831909.1 hypothetical protein [Geitlerinema sp. CS-897]OAB60245.1 hypothetical protein AY599_22790 [Leptolyngbya valderiana BDU 20041]PPT05568.1 hypothetical protein CKA32_004297 [Geitlerinema sp. FC II]